MTAISVEVDYDAIRANVEVLCEYAREAEVMAVVKADAYGHGLVESARAARSGGATWLGVAQPHEALALRQSGDTGRILTWLYGPEVHAGVLIAHDIDVSVNSAEVLATVVTAAQDRLATARVHICVDTGLGREGVTSEQLPTLLAAALQAQSAGAIRIVGMWSHLAWADAPGHPTIDAQAAAFRQALWLAQEQEIVLEVRHLANSAATLTRPDLHFDLVRPGIAVYGLPPVADPEGNDFGLTPAMRVTSHVALVKEVGAGQGVSYGHDYVTAYSTCLGLIPAGYADGVFRAAGGVAEVAIHGRRYRIAGRVCMDQFVVDLGLATDVTAGDVVTLIGPDGPTASDWASAVDTINYEIVCRFGKSRHQGGA
jgi:alanine racemase